MTPRGEAFASRKVKAAGMVPSAHKRLPFPSVIGKIFKHHSSTRSCFSSVWMRFALPCTCNAGSSCYLSFCISWTTSPRRSVELLKSSLLRVCEATYFLEVLRLAATGSSSLFWDGQCAANIS